MVIDLTRHLLSGLRLLAASAVALIAAARTVATPGLPAHRRARTRPHPATREPATAGRADLGATTLEMVILILGLMGIAALLVAALYRVVNNYIGQIK